MEIYFLIAAFFCIAFIYSSVGFGGGSSYLALLALPVFGLAFPIVRSTALFCNIVVVGGGTFLFWKEGKLKWSEVWPYIIASVPAAYLGAFWPVRDQFSFILLGITLIVAAFLLWFQPTDSKTAKSPIPETSIRKAVAGGAIGLLSGLVGIGGGIFLSPLLHFLRWSDAKRISALASLFILVNSIGGLVGQFQRGLPALSLSFLVPLLVAVLAGGQLGSRVGIRTFNPLYIKRITAVLIFVAGINILKDHL